MLWRDNIFESFLFVFHHPEILFAELLNTLKEHEMSVRNLRIDVK
jgi:hypothetical protein